MQSPDIEATHLSLLCLGRMLLHVIGSRLVFQGYYVLSCYTFSSPACMPISINVVLICSIQTYLQHSFISWHSSVFSEDVRFPLRRSSTIFFLLIICSSPTREKSTFYLDSKSHSWYMEKIARNTRHACTKPIKKRPIDTFKVGKFYRLITQEIQIMIRTLP